MINILFSANPNRWPEYKKPLETELRARGLTFSLGTEGDPKLIDFIIYGPNSGLTDFTPYTNCRAVLNLWAGVENIVGNETLTMPLARMVDHGMTRGMVEWVTGHTLRHHLGMDAHVSGQDGQWRGALAPLACNRPVTILGMGALGQACAKALTHLEFPVIGWSRTPKKVVGVTALHGQNQLELALKTSEIVVLLMPLTDQTRHMMNAERLACLPKGAILINPGRGLLIDDTALLQALDSNRLAHATLDVFDIEPLPPTHAFWHHPKVTVTPHIASATRPESASRVIADNILRGVQGQPLLHLVNRQSGY
ncbi:MAG: glyoxylate/hydroxypyruvate reductase A [Paracoccaceae bacterium]|nr:glyoxylate/hydroxypyruvate reductase A [Paracoccaceae bacterium]